MNRTLTHADAFEALRELADDHAHAAVIDYPWEFNYQNGTGRYGYDHDADAEAETDDGYYGPMGDADMFEMEPDERFTELVGLLADKLVSGAWVFALADDRFQDTVRTAFKEHDEWVFRRNWAWTPESMGMGYYGRIDHYPIPTATLGETDRKVTDRPTLLRVPGGREPDYPTGKPVDLYRKLLADPVLRDGERLLEPFCGTAPGYQVAAERELRYWGCDVDLDAIGKAEQHASQERIGAYAAPDGGRSREEAGEGPE